MAAGICRAPRKYGVCADNLLNVLKPIQIDCGGGFLAFFLNHEKEFQIDYAITYHFTGKVVWERWSSKVSFSIISWISLLEAPNTSPILLSLIT